MWEKLFDVSHFSVYSCCFEMSGSTVLKINETISIQEEMGLLSKLDHDLFSQRPTAFI